ncbi:MAG: hypothetical protein LIO65_05790 [Odoribacter sp.]|nr:hypothetical protein [Odoribacter sp.]
MTPAQEQFIISLANIAALYDVGGELETMKQDLVNYPSNNALYTKYNKLNNPERYIAGWTSEFNSGGERTYCSGEIRNSGFELKFYPTKNGEVNALGLVKSNWAGHAIEAALEFLERKIVERTDKDDDFLYDMHLFNAVNFMNDYCK